MLGTLSKALLPPLNTLQISLCLQYWAKLLPSTQRPCWCSNSWQYATNTLYTTRTSTWYFSTPHSYLEPSKNWNRDNLNTQTYLTKRKLIFTLVLLLLVFFILLYPAIGTWIQHCYILVLATTLLHYLHSSNLLPIPRNGGGPNLYRSNLLTNLRLFHHRLPFLLCNFHLDLLQ